MKNTKLARFAPAPLVRIFGSIALAALLIFSMAACDDGNTGGGGGGTTAPVLSAGSVNRTSDTEAAIGFTTDKAGTAYYIVQNSGATAPAKTAVKAGTSLGAVTVGANSSLAVTLTDRKSVV
jgi:hypothetical protein